MKKPFLISAIALTAILVLVGHSITSSSFAQTSAPTESRASKTVIVKSTQIISKGYSFIRIYYGDNKTEKIELEKISGIESEENNFNKIVTVLNKLNSEGYEIVSSTELGLSGGNVSTFVLKK